MRGYFYYRSSGEGNESHDDRASDDGKGIFLVLTRFVEGAKREIWHLSALSLGSCWSGGT